MHATGRTAAVLEDLLERLERLEDDVLQSIEGDPSLFRVPGVLDLTGQLKNALRSLRAARDATRALAAAHDTQGSDVSDAAAEAGSREDTFSHHGLRKLTPTKPAARNRGAGNGL